jgi:Zn-finger nucleic acid-binding protein
MSDRQGVEIDCCPQCRGVWQERRELDELIERRPRRHRRQPNARPPGSSR